MPNVFKKIGKEVQRAGRNAETVVAKGVQQADPILGKIGKAVNTAKDQVAAEMKRLKDKIGAFQKQLKDLKESKEINANLTKKQLELEGEIARLSAQLNALSKQEKEVDHSLDTGSEAQAPSASAGAAADASAPAPAALVFAPAAAAALGAQTPSATGAPANAAHSAGTPIVTHLLGGGGAPKP